MVALWQFQIWWKQGLRNTVPVLYLWAIEPHVNLPHDISANTCTRLRSLWAISLFFLKKLVLPTHTNKGLFGKGLRYLPQTRTSWHLSKGKPTQWQQKIIYVFLVPVCPIFDIELSLKRNFMQCFSWTHKEDFQVYFSGLQKLWAGSVI